MYDKIANYQDLTLKECDLLSDEIAQFLASKTSFDVDTIMRNISVLEVTMAIHKVFDLTQDTLIFDDIQQSLVDQVLRGEGELLQLRSIKSHSSQSNDNFHYHGGLPGDGLSLALAKAINNEHQTIIISDDNALNHGATYEALLEIGRLKANVTLVLMDEQKSLLRHYNSVNAAIKSVRISKVYTDTKRDVKTVLSSNPISRPLLNTLTHFRDAIKDAVIEPTIFTQFGFDYHGPINGQKFSDLIKIFKLAQSMTGPNVIHVQTRVKEKEFRKLEFPAFKTDHDRPDNYSDYIETLDRVMTLHQDIVMVNDVKYPSDHFKEFQLLYPDQYHTTNGSLNLILPMALGLSNKEVKPVISISSHLANELLSRLDQHSSHMESLIIIIRDAGLSSKGQALNHGIYDFSLATICPDFKVRMAKDMNEASYIMEYALNQKQKMILRIPSGNEKVEHQVLQFEDVWDQIIPFTDKSKGVIITFGPSLKMLHRKITINNLDIGLINARTINSIDESIIKDIHDKGLPVLIYNCEGRYDLLSHTLYEYLMHEKIMMNVTSFNLNKVDLSLSARQIKDKYKLSIDDCIHFLNQ